MKLKALFIITAIITIPFGVAMVIIPEQLYLLYGNESNVSLDYMEQLFGTALIGIGLICWQSRNLTNTEFGKIIVFALFIANGIGAVIALFNQLNNVVNVLGWVTVASYILLFIGYGYFQFIKSSLPES
jgi:hypothetical protein